VKTHEFEEVASQLMARVNTMVWCNVATIDSQGRPRSRILHPLWEGATAWITTDPRSLKSRHLARRPYVSLAYVSDVAKPAYADCLAEWVDDPAIKQHVWELCLQTPPPMGFDPAPIYSTPEAPGEGQPQFGVLKLTPYRIQLVQWPAAPMIWTPAD
jgi:general stress protein 26